MAGEGERVTPSVLQLTLLHVYVLKIIIMHSHFCWEKERDRYNVYATLKKKQREVGEKIRSSEIEHFGAERERERERDEGVLSSVGTLFNASLIFNTSPPLPVVCLLRSQTRRDHLKCQFPPLHAVIF